MFLIWCVYYASATHGALSRALGIQFSQTKSRILEKPTSAPALFKYYQNKSHYLLARDNELENYLKKGKLVKIIPLSDGQFQLLVDPRALPPPSSLTIAPINEEEIYDNAFDLSPTASIQFHYIGLAIIFSSTPLAILLFARAIGLLASARDPLPKLTFHAYNSMRYLWLFLRFYNSLPPTHKTRSKNSKGAMATFNARMRFSAFMPERVRSKRFMSFRFIHYRVSIRHIRSDSFGILRVWPVPSIINWA